MWITVKAQSESNVKSFFFFSKFFPSGLFHI